MFTTQDIAQITAHGVSLEQATAQIQHFQHGFPPLKVLRAASIHDGILAPDASQMQQAIERYEALCDDLDIVKFVPASGAATRMFKELYAFVDEGRRSDSVDYLLRHIREIAFWEELQTTLPDGASDREIAEYIIRQGLHYGTLPKGLVTFHRYADGVRKAVEEHLVEGALYAASNGVVKLHFTVSPEHQAKFEALLSERLPHYEQLFNLRFEISYSQQDPATDTLAVNPDNTLFRTDEGQLLFRPAGHGALIENLNQINADVVFIKNIDNVTNDAHRDDTIRYKKLLAGLLLTLQDRCFEYIRALDTGGAELETIAEFIQQRLCVRVPERYGTRELRAILNRPLRICGMVRNEGEPGGGPFWVVNDDGTESLQIVESSQIDAAHRELLQHSTHFNPVDLVCAPRDVRGVKFDLRNYVDPQTGFISNKSASGRELKALELPGLWNGAMAQWNTLFVDVPITTFSPVKTVTDLLRPQHQ